MKLQIKTINQKSLVVDIEETKTVYDLKKELSFYPDIGVKPELQKLIYAGKILSNEDNLITYNIDVKKYLVILILKQPLEEPSKITQLPSDDVKKEIKKIKVEDTRTANDSNTPSETARPTNSEFKTPVDKKKDDLVSRIVGMGYSESEVKRALEASYYSPERAIEYLIEGIPNSVSTHEDDSSSDTDIGSQTTRFRELRSSTEFQRLRIALRENPHLLDAGIERLGNVNPELLDFICENQQEILTMIFDDSDDENCVVEDSDEEDQNHYSNNN